MSLPIVVLITAPETAAQPLATALLERRLIACANVLPGATSIYRWEGRVESEREALLICKTTAERYAQLEAAVSALHPYDVPECIALRSHSALAAYGQWVADETRPASDAATP